MSPEQAKQRVEAHFNAHLQAIEAARQHLAPLIVEAAALCAGALEGGGKILLCGNGGSAADCQHIAAEFCGRYVRARPGLAALALTTDSSALTAIANDFGFEQVFARQIEALARPGDVLLAYSSSGESPNVLEAVQRARSLGCLVIGLCGRDGGRLAPMADLALTVPAQATSHIQEVHGLIGHLICDLCEMARAD